MKTDARQAVTLLRQAEDAAQEFITHCTTCLNCDTTDTSAVKLCSVGVVKNREYMAASELAQPYVIAWKQETGQLVAASA